MTLSNSDLIRALYTITADYQSGFEAQVDALLRLGCERLNLEIGILAEIRPPTYFVRHFVAPPEVPLAKNTELDASCTYCQLTLSAGETVTIEHMGEQYATHPAYKAFGLESYVGIPIWIGKERYGTLNFSSPHIHQRHFNTDDIEAMQLMATWISTEMAREQTLQELLSAQARLEQTNARLLELSLTDPLTELDNRRAIMRELSTILHRSSRVGTPACMMLIDLDNFKQINDNYGHDIGDQVLQTIAGILQDCVRGGDSAGRFGGEEFVLLLPITSLQDACQVAERVRQRIEASDTFEFPLSASLGVAQFHAAAGYKPDIEACISELVQASDQAMYAAKNAGKNCVQVATGTVPADGSPATCPPA